MTVELVAPRRDQIIRAYHSRVNVIEMVCEELEVESVPKTLLCNAHPLMLFQHKEVEVTEIDLLNIKLFISIIF